MRLFFVSLFDEILWTAFFKFELSTFELNGSIYYLNHPLMSVITWRNNVLPIQTTGQIHWRPSTRLITLFLLILCAKFSNLNLTFSRQLRNKQAQLMYSKLRALRISLITQLVSIFPQIILFKIKQIKSQPW